MNVCHFLLDDEAYRSGTSVYLADRVIPMLPFQLSNDLCSLNHDEDRYAMSCLMDVAPDGTVKTEKISKIFVVRSGGDAAEPVYINIWNYEGSHTG